ncbi:Translation initiation factor 3 subunit b [Dissophora globulifera]|nr:Translation initiation factor 3 subunit b [Dissophora globulifera]
MASQNPPHQEAAEHRHCCSIIPSYVLKDIADSNNVSDSVRAIATKSLSFVTTIHHARTSAQGDVSNPSTAPGTNFAARPIQRHLLRIYDSKQLGVAHLPGTEVYVEGKNGTSLQSLDKSCQNVYEHFKNIIEFYLKEFKRNSYDGKGADLHISVHVDDDPGPGFDNAFWYPGPNLYQWAFGDGDNELFDNFTKLLDISGHEFTHAVVQYTGQLPYYWQSGALNESMADVFGSMIKQYFAPGGPQKAEDADWLVGEGIWLVPGPRALRDMENPGTAFDIPGVTKDRQPAHMDHYEELPVTDDWGGVHIYSGIPNRAFVLVAKALGGFSWEVAGQIWYDSLTDPSLRELFDSSPEPDPPIKDAWGRSGPLKNTFKIFANLTIKHAQAHSPETAAAVTDAWKDVGVLR